MATGGLTPFPGSDLEVAGVAIRAQELWILAVAAVLIAAVWWFYDRTLLGKALRACAEQPTAARLVGISLKRASMLSFLIAGLTGAVAGVIASPVYFTSWESGLQLGLRGFVAAALGGPSSDSHRPAADLPVGRQRLLEVARALATEPDLLLLDEPMAGLSAAERHGLALLLRRLRAGGMAVVLVEHDPTVIAAYLGVEPDDADVGRVAQTLAEDAGPG